eukprot:CAMPEP_0202713614 /NCGR_PEP_ID=MMETSP1385-20130828/56937_1 /ASSEMBLY_ACC=CAM_ASM_000861 /TAXON_ID=933848 /ORGANISM="Elphidium margaritaceum" /LENGTH=341 /DNA_ID=CAMNT_0049374025 /DNA_START=37 /DNA_END=1062 /DNA_ORIENTATION=-
MAYATNSTATSYWSSLGDYKQWNSAQLIDWILSIDASFEQKYKATLTVKFTEFSIVGRKIDSLDREDLTLYGIINVYDRKKIYGQMQTLIAQQKRTDYQQENVASLSEDDDDNGEARDKSTHLSQQQWTQLKQDGYCVLDDPLKNEAVVTAVSGYIRSRFSEQCMVTPLLRLIVQYYHSRYNTALYAEIYCKTDDALNCTYFLAPKQNLQLSGLLSSFVDHGQIDIDQVPPATMHHVLRYLGHHKGQEPDPLPSPIHSVHMSQVCSDKWDAAFIDAFDKKTVFAVILAVNYLNIKSLLHLGCAKIASLIKQLDQREIDRIVAEEERYRREQQESQDNEDTN